MRGTPAREALAGAITAITAAGSETPRLDAELLLCDVLGVGREQLLTDRTLSVAGGAVRAFQDAVRRRSIEREPVAYILGRRGFRHLELRSDPRALVPRPETELLVEAGLELPRGAHVLDLCTGGGAVALALKHERPDLHLAGSDLSAAALELARENSSELGLDVAWLQADLLEGLPDAYEAVLANPPYVADTERARLAPEILRHEPHEALFAGPDGLEVIRPLLEQVGARDRIRTVAIEIGRGHAPAVLELAAAQGFVDCHCKKDLAGVERVIIGERG